MIFFCPQNTIRVRYVVEFCSKELFDTPVTLVDDIAAFRTASGPKINYSDLPAMSDAINIRPSGLLFATGIEPQRIACFEHNGRKAFFPTNGDLPFDIFSAMFYLITRYEEYGPYEK